MNTSLRNIEIITSLVETYEIGQGCGIWKDHGDQEVTNYFRATIEQNNLLSSKEDSSKWNNPDKYLYMYTNSEDLDNPLEGVDPDLILRDDFNQLIYLFKIN